MAKTPARKTAKPPTASAQAETVTADKPAEETIATAAEGAVGSDGRSDDAADAEAAEDTAAAAAEVAAVAAVAAAPVPPPVGANGTRWYRVVSPLDHDQQPYAIGAELELTEVQAEPLLGHTVQPKTGS